MYKWFWMTIIKHELDMTNITDKFIAFFDFFSKLVFIQFITTKLILMFSWLLWNTESKSHSSYSAHGSISVLASAQFQLSSR